MLAPLAALLLALATGLTPPSTAAPPFVLGYRTASLVTLGVAPAVAADPQALRRVATTACAGRRPCAARIWVGRAPRFATMSTAERRQMVAAYRIAADGAARFVCGPAGAAPATCGALAARVESSIRQRPAI